MSLWGTSSDAMIAVVQMILWLLSWSLRASVGEMGPGVLDPSVGNRAPLSLSGRLCLGCSGGEWSG